MTKPDDTPAWDGRPERPDEDGWHWLARDKAPHPYRWIAGEARWTLAGSVAEFRYLGPCAPPGEFRRGWEAGRAAAAASIGCGCVQAAEVVKLPPNSARRWELCGQPNCCAFEAAAIHAMEPPT